MSLLWAFVPELAAAGEYVLDADESRHVTARRLRVGDALTLFNGAGSTGEARIEGLSKRAVQVVVERVEENSAPASACVLATAIPKGDRLSTMLQMLTQLGAASWQPLILADSAVRSLDPESKRLQRICVESAKVARRPWLLSVAKPCRLDELLEARASEGGDGAVFFGDREGAGSGLSASAELVLIGPEAGFTEEERARLLSAGALPCSFSPHNLRIEVAAIGAAVALNLVSTSAALGQGVSGERVGDG
ncbi:MAG: 16S rRNA (uracil(1498)-N(3))-methyltransferase [Myxococcota bacterium]